MADALGSDLPRIEIPHRVGHLEDYPSGASTLEGDPIPTGDRVFPNPPSINVSDVGSVSSFLSVGETQTNTASMSTDLGVSGSLGVAGFTFTASVGFGFSSSYALSVGESATFTSSIPPLPNDPSTPQDEYAENQYTVTPWLYRQRYTNPAGEDAGYYVLMHSAQY